MKIALLGYGKMGREIEKCALERGHIVSAVIDKDNLVALNKKTLNNCDVVFEFTSPEAAGNNVISCLKEGLSVVSGSTGWLSRYAEAIDACKKGDTSFIHSSNFSLGVNIFFRINSVLALLMNRYGEYVPEITEIHHIQKLDAPSGTAIKAAQLICEVNNGYSGWQKKEDNDKNKIPIESIREGVVPGTHSVTWSSEFDKLTLSHEAFSRQGFALGAVIAAEYINGKKGIYTMDHVLGF